MPSHHSAARHLISKGIFDDLELVQGSRARLSALSDENSKVVGDALVRREGSLASRTHAAHCHPATPEIQSESASSRRNRLPKGRIRLRRLTPPTLKERKGPTGKRPTLSLQPNHFP